VDGVLRCDDRGRAALAGLLFVAVSLNLDNILKSTMLPARAAETLAILLFVMISSALALVPQDVELLGAEILIIAAPLTAITARSQLKFQRQNPDLPLQWSVSRAAASGVALVPGMIAGVSLAAHWTGGLYWLVPTALLGIAGAVYSAWVLLVEIVR
jgi:modulator of FtsH protease